jgi:hypothetical protein
MIETNNRYAKFRSPHQIRYYQFKKLLLKHGYRPYVYRQFDRVEDIARRALGDPSMYWVILACNAIEDPFATIIPGTILLLPAKSILEEVNK